MHPRAPHWVAIAAVAGALLAWWLWPQGADAPTSETPVSTDAQGRVRLTRQQERNLGIRTERSRAATDVPVTGLPAEAMSPLATTTQVTVPFAGVVTRVLVDEGEQVRRGQPLLRVQSRDFIALQGELARVRAESGAAKEQARRDALLAKEGIIPAARRIESEARSAAASASVTEASAMLSQLRRPAEGMPGEYDILAPQAGRILRRGVRPGQAMEAMAPAFVMAGSTELDIVFTSPIGLHSTLRPGLAVHLPDGGVATVVAVGADTDALSQSLRVRARAEHAGALVPGQQFEVALSLPPPEDAVEVPASALLPHGEQQVLYLLDETGYRGLVVVPLGSDGGRAVVSAKGLRPGMQVVVAGASVLKSLAPTE
ncbi:efflux RND transporter periplasmic adaptor subunit [Pseudoxanthomonas mexicana]|uniref:Efflux RND transporter periplasmic adaptor subunit n=1 Tax=Pseudoxanthomonas mexicana TaxID=128785 RepID=A0A7G9TDG2_PSEMX|nr:efflux RND transporter periplasmic adaptor subunit [Pseudoxanthomonas mexicana]QNN78137.1 efflux RND transporter periplasmic adaptor subunit [Pseudoxanthomonas mexicana]TXH12375.1 MAG: efflux RND transporter periplasmic adaptor subunit [Gammaproteobacteria bacterium]